MLVNGAIWFVYKTFMCTVSVESYNIMCFSKNFWIIRDIKVLQEYYERYTTGYKRGIEL